MRVSMRSVAETVALMVAMLGGACATTSAPLEQVSSTKASIRAAEELQAQRDPQAAMHLQVAREHLKNAEAFIEDGDNDKAKWALERANVDANLALRLSKLIEAREDAQQAKQRVSDLGTPRSMQGVTPAIPSGQQPAMQPGTVPESGQGQQPQPNVPGEGNLQREQPQNPQGTEGMPTPEGDQG